MVLGLLPAMGPAAFAAGVELQEEEIPEMWLNIIDTRNNRYITRRGVGMHPGEELTLQVKAQYFDERQTMILNPQWETDNCDVAYVSNNQVYTVMPGTARLSVSYTDLNGLTASAYIDVKVAEGNGYYVELRDEDDVPVSLVDTVQGDDFFLNGVVMDESTGELVQEPYILWRSEDDTMAEVNVDGHVWVNQTGSCKIYGVYFGEDGYDYTVFTEVQATLDENLESATVKIGDITQLDYPRLGEIPDYAPKLKYSGYTTFQPENSEYAQYVKNGIAWYDATTDKFLVPDVDMIEEDRVYDVLVFLEANAGKPFDEMLNVTCCGITCQLSDLEEYDSDYYVAATVKDFCTVDEKADEKITAISLKLDPPAIGETPDFTAEKLGHSSECYFLGAPYSQSGFYGGIGWYDVTADKYLSRTDVFEAGHSYRVSIAVQPGLGYDMASSEWSVPAVDITLDVGGSQTVTTECYTGTRAAKGFIITGAHVIAEQYYPITTEYAVAYNADGQVITRAKAGDLITVKHTGYDYQVINNWYIQPSVPVTYYADRAVFTMPVNAISVKAVFETTVISHVKVEIDFPVEGKAADFEPTILTNGCEIGLPWGVTTFHNGIQWYDETADSYLVPGDVFEAGHSYVLNVGIKVLDFHNFNINEMTGFVSGIGAVSVTPVGNESKYYYRMLVSNTVTPAEVHDVVIHNGIAYNADGEKVTSAVRGDRLTIIANEDPNRGFGGWVELSGHGVSLDAGNSTITITMPDGDLELEATYADIPITSLELSLEGYYKGNAAHQMKLTWDNWNIVPFCENCYEDQNYVICMDNNNNPSSFLYGNMTTGPYWLRVGIRTFEEYTLDYLTEENITLTVDGVTMNTVRLERGDNNAMVLHFFLGAPVEVNWNILWITGGQAYFNGYPVDRAPAGAKIDLILDDTPLEGQTFAGWKDEFGYVTEFIANDNNDYSFIMPDSYVSIGPVYTGALYRVDINMVDPPEDGMRPDYEVELPADAGYELTSDNVFNNACVNGVWWSVEYEDGSGDVLDPETAVFDFEEGKGQFYTVSFSLAAKDGYWFATNEEGGYILEGYVDGVAANLNYPDNHTKYLGVTMSFYTRDSYSITVEGGNAYNPRQQGNTPTETPITSAYPGDYIKVVADPVEGKNFSHWEIVTGTIKIAEEDMASETIWFAMAEEPVELRAVYKSTVPTLTLKYPTVSFEDVIVMNIYYSASNLEDVVEMGLVVYNANVSQANIATANAVVPGYEFVEAEGFYCAHTNGIAPKCLGDTLYFAAYAKLADGTYTYTKVVSYSPKTYAYAQLSSGAASMKPLVVAMLNYGAEAQKYFNYNTANLVNANLTAAQKALVVSYSSDLMATIPAVSTSKVGSFAANGGFTRRYPTISFEGAFSINYYCLPEKQPVGDIILYVWNEADYVAASKLTTSNASETIKMELTDSGEYLAVVDGIAAKYLDKGIYVAFVYSDGTTTYSTGILGYSIGTYCNNLAADTTSQAALAKATAVYGYQAKQYFG